MEQLKDCLMKIGVRIEKIDYSPEEKLIKMIGVSSSVINYDSVRTVEENFFDRLGLKLKVIIKVNTEKAFDDIFEEYKCNIEHMLFDDSFDVGRGNKKHTISMEDNNITIRVENNILCLSLLKKGIDIVIKERIAFELSEDVIVNIICEEKEENLIAFQEESVSKIEELSNDISEQKALLQQEKRKNREKSVARRNSKDENMIYGKNFKEDPMDIAAVTDVGGNIVVSGEVFAIEKREIKTKPKAGYKNQEDKSKYIHIFSITDYTNSISCKLFTDDSKDLISKGQYLIIKGNIVMDNFAKELTLSVKSICEGEKIYRKDTAKEKRVELHLHTNMSQMDGINSVKDMVKMAADFGHKAIAITDHGVVQAFPDAMGAGEKNGVKILYGVEGYLIDDEVKIVENPNEKDFNQSFVVFDIETTGLSANFDMVTEIGAVKIVGGEIVDSFSQLVNPEIPIPSKIIELNGITDMMVMDKPRMQEVLPKFLEFIGNSVLVAHNASFDTGFIKAAAKRYNLHYDYIEVDTVTLARLIYPKLRNHKLNTLSKYLGIALENHHRAEDDARATAMIFMKLIDEMKKLGVETLADINYKLGKVDPKSIRSKHITILAKNQEGIKDLYKLISAAHMDYFYNEPRIPKSLLRKNKNNLLIGTACEEGELYSAILSGKSEEDIAKIIKLYDYVEIMPLENNALMIKKNIVGSKKDLMEINKKLVELGEKYSLLVVATGDVHYCEPYEGKYRAILQYGMKHNNVSEESCFYFKTTDEMLEEFEYLGRDKAYEVVVKNTNLIADMIEEVLPVPKGTFPPIIEGADEEFREMCMKKAESMYGIPLPKIVEARLERELKSIIGNGYAVMYIIAQRIVKDSIDHGFLVGSRGSVGSSFAATMSGITEVNPLCPHYRCNKCKYSKFFENGEYGSGPDMPDAICPDCGEKLIKDGFEIPFEVFLGFEGDKEPDIDLNFAGDYQANAHRYTGELLGEKNTFKAGTIGTIAEKTAYGYVMKYLEETGQFLNKAEIERLRNGCTGIKRSTGQHPGGVMVVPDYKDVYDFTPIQYPANDSSSGVVTTHFDYHSISGKILKLDILGHDVPSMIRQLEEFTGLKGTEVPLDDPGTMSLFTSFKALNCDLSPIDCTTGSLGVPEFGTRFVRQMLMDTMPTTFAELVRISGLSHGTDVWLNNAQDFVREGITTLKDVISTRDDIMVYLMHKGLKPKNAFKIMENVRKGKGLTEEHIEEMVANNVPPWYIESCQKIKYMFPKAHAAAYVVMSFRIAYFKLHYKEAYYATFFTTKTDDFDIALIYRGKGAVLQKIKELERMGNEVTAKEKTQLGVLESVYEMYARGVEMLNVDIYNSDPKRFLLKDGKILPPLISVQGLGETAALKIHEESKREFLSLEDFRTRTKASKTVIETLLAANCLVNLPETNQLSLF